MFTVNDTIETPDALFRDDALFNSSLTEWAVNGTGTLDVASTFFMP